MDDLRDVERPHQIWAVLDGQKSFHSGYMDKATAEYQMTEANKRATELGIRSRYVLESKPVPEVKPEVPSV